MNPTVTLLFSVSLAVATVVEPAQDEVKNGAPKVFGTQEKHDISSNAQSLERMEKLADGRNSLSQSSD